MNDMQADIIIALLREISAKLGPDPVSIAAERRPRGSPPLLRSRTQIVEAERRRGTIVRSE